MFKQRVEDSTDTERWLDDVRRELPHYEVSDAVGIDLLCSVTVFGSILSRSAVTSYDLPSVHLTDEELYRLVKFKRADSPVLLELVLDALQLVLLQT